MARAREIALTGAPRAARRRRLFHRRRHAAGGHEPGADRGGGRVRAKRARRSGGVDRAARGAARLGGRAELGRLRRVRPPAGGGGVPATRGTLDLQPDPAAAAVVGGVAGVAGRRSRAGPGAGAVQPADLRYWVYGDAFMAPTPAVPHLLPARPLAFRRVVVRRRVARVPLRPRAHGGSAAAGVAACAMYALCPNLAGHASLVGTDAGTAVVMTAATWLWWRFCRAPSWRRAALAAVAIALRTSASFTRCSSGPWRC